MMRLWFGSVVVVAALADCTKTEPPVVPPVGGNPSVGGAGAGGTGGTGGAPAVDPFKCEAPDPSATAASLHAAAADVLTTMGRNATTGVVGACAFSSCHNTPQGKAMLVLQGVTDLTTLRGKLACQVPTMPLVAPNGGDAALRNSWLYLKLVAPADPLTFAVTPDPAWGAGNLCGATPGKPFGERMPMSSGKILDEVRLAPIRKWICAGAQLQ